LRVLLYVGRFRPKSKHDFGEDLVRRISRGRHSIAGLILSKGDPLTIRMRNSGIPVFNLLPILDQPLSEIKASLRDRKCKENLSAWLGKLSALNPDIGVVFYGGWLPPELFRLPVRGFVNYHPAPLPDLRGVEPDTFAVLEGRKTMWGTVHKVSSSYDEGSIIGRTTQMKVARYMTPVVVWHTLTEYGINAVLRALDRIYNGGVIFEKQAKGSAGLAATRKRARFESVIKWNSDTPDMIHRRLLAFCGQDISIRLKADVGGKRYCVRDLEIHRGRFPGRPGDIIGWYGGRGKYLKQPVVCAKGGVVVLELGRLIRLGAESSEEPLFNIIPSCRRRQITDVRTIRRSIFLE